MQSRNHGNCYMFSRLPIRTETWERCPAGGFVTCTNLKKGERGMDFWVQLLNVLNDIAQFKELYPLAFGVLVWQTVVFSVIGFSVLKKITDSVVKKRTKKIAQEKQKG